ncbi:MAG: hypothetical protein HOB07_09585 [Chloroflexi bacterium]|nr:hypothetical protein [Chloroflexota bacterium]
MASSNDPIRSQPILVNEIPWVEGAPGMRTRPLWEDPATDRKAHIVEFEPGAGMPLHRHVGHELIYLIEGSLVDESGTLRPGNVAYRPNGCVHSNSSPNGAIALAIIAGGNEDATEIGDAPGSDIHVPEDLSWETTPRGTYTKRLVANEAAKMTAAINRFPTGAGIPKHQHHGDELIFVIEGASEDEGGRITPGNLSYRPNGTVHTVSTALGATIFGVVWGHTEAL